MNRDAVYTSWRWLPVVHVENLATLWEVMRHKSVVYFLVIAIAFEGAGCAGQRTVVRGQNPEGPVIPCAVPSGLATAPCVPLAETQRTASTTAAKESPAPATKPRREGWLHRNARRLACVVQAGTKDRREGARLAVVGVIVIAATIAVVWGSLWYAENNSSFNNTLSPP